MEKHADEHFLHFPVLWGRGAGTLAATGRIIIASRAKREREASNTLRGICTCFAMIKTTPDQLRYIT
jgi:hypothetical protein